ncbi:WXG100 family type VII secretion target [Nocardia terrae]|uniref:WXG100 family type VII secretion target n=1 Tax=Nocardia terrae TaxID=2675851 RepID=UPI0018DF75D3|nr:WXG100 family type VII secretion target [Nocardia terrae]
MGTPTIPQVKAWDPDVLNTQATEWDQKAQKLGDTLDAAARSVDGSHHYWIGDAGNSMRDRHDEIHGNAKTVHDALENGATAARNGATTIQAAKTTLLNKITDAEGKGFTVSDTGEVKIGSYMLMMLQLMGGDKAQGPQAAMESRAQDYQKDIQAALVDCGTADDNAMTAVNNAFANLTTTQIQQPTTDQLDQLTADQARKDLEAIKDGSPDADAALARLRMATTLSDQDKQDLNSGDSISLAQYPYVQAFTQGMNDMSNEDIDQLGSKLNGNGHDQAQAAIANDFRIVSNPQVHSPDGKNTGGISQLPKDVQKALTEDPSVLAKTTTVANQYSSVDMSSYDANKAQSSMAALGDLMSKGDNTIQGSDINRAMIKQGAEIAALHPSDKGMSQLTPKLADTFLQNASGDHTAVRDALIADANSSNPDARAAATRMDLTCTPGGHYNANDHIVDILQHQWSPDQHGAENMFKYIGDDAGAANQFQQQRAGESAQSLATIIAHNEATLSHDVPGAANHASFGELNPGLSQVVAKSLEPYIPNLVGVSDPDLKINHYCGNLDTAGSTDASPDAHGNQLNHTPGDLSNLFKVIDSNPDAAKEFNNAAAHLAGQLDYDYGTGNYPHAANEQGQLTGAMKNGLTDELSTLIKIDHDNAGDAATAAYNKKTEIADIVTGIISTGGAISSGDLPVSPGGLVSSAANVLDPIIKAQIQSPDMYNIDQAKTHWNTDLASVTRIDANNTFRQDANIINGYNSKHDGTFEQFNNHQYNGRTYQFFDSQGRPNMDVIEHNQSAFDDAKDSIIGQKFFDSYYDKQRAGLANPDIIPQEDGPK